MTQKVLFSLLFVPAFAFFFLTGCATAKNTGVAVKEGATDAGQQVAKLLVALDEGQIVEDGSITAAVKMKFANDELVSASDINVDTSNGVVTLKGTVGSKAEADRALKLGRSVDGVKSVDSQLVVRSGKR